jgi:YidC/Oxa1 family membrane protein insertase
MPVAAIWDGLKNYLFLVLQFLYAGVHDYGFAIVLLTVAFRILMTPLMWKQTKSMIELQKVQPKIKALQEKYKNNKEKQQEELMKFYKENKVNPFGGCLPLLLQMPLLFALYQVLGGTAAAPGNLLRHLATNPGISKAFWVILPDITRSPQAVYQAAAANGFLPAVWTALPYLIFAVLFALSTWLPQYLLTKDPTQRRTASWMAVMMLWFGFVSPAGVLIYWVTSSAWQVGQQVLTQRILAAKDEESADSEPPSGAATKGKTGTQPKLPGNVPVKGKAGAKSKSSGKGMNKAKEGAES